MWCQIKKACTVPEQCIGLYDPRAPIVPVSLVVPDVPALVELPVISSLNNQLLAIIVPQTLSFKPGTVISLSGVGPAYAEKIQGNLLSIQFVIEAMYDGVKAVVEAPVVIRVPVSGENGNVTTFINRMCIGYAVMANGTTDVTVGGAGKYVCEDKNLEYDPHTGYLSGSTSHFTAFSLIEYSSTPTPPSVDSAVTLIPLSVLLLALLAMML
jgi:hypothetical protein